MAVNQRLKHNDFMDTIFVTRKRESHWGEIPVIICVSIGGQSPKDLIVKALIICHLKQSPLAKRKITNMGSVLQREEKAVRKISRVISYNHSWLTLSLKFDSSGTLSGSADDTEEIDEAISEGKMIGFRIYNPEFMYRVRLLCHHTSHPELFKGVKKTCQ